MPFRFSKSGVAMFGQVTRLTGSARENRKCKLCSVEYRVEYPNSERF